MAIPTLKNKHIAQVLGSVRSPSDLEDMLLAGWSYYQIGGAFGVSAARMRQLLNGPDPLPEMPLNWAGYSPATDAPPYWHPVYRDTPKVPWTGINGGYTYGPAVFAECVLAFPPYPTPAPDYPGQVIN